MREEEEGITSHSIVIIVVNQALNTKVNTIELEVISTIVLMNVQDWVVEQKHS